MKKINCKYFLIIILILTFYSCKRSNNIELKESKIIETVTDKQLEKKECKKGKNSALTDFNNGKYKLLSYGLPSYEDWDFQNYYEKYIKEKYDIEIGNGGCEVFDDTECYSNTMEKLIYEKFGKDIFIKARKQAQFEYKKHIKNRILNNEIFYRFDTKPEFMGGKEKMNLYLNEKIKNLNDYKGKIKLLFVVEKNGKISEVRIIGKENKDEKLPIENEIIEIFKNMPKWKPATYENEKVRARIGIPIIIN